MVLLSRRPILLMLGLLASPLTAAELPPGFTEQLVVDGLDKPTAMAFAPDGRLFIAQQTGQLLVVRNGALLPTPFLEVPVSGAGEQGLLGVAFDPDFASNGFVYVNYTTRKLRNRVSRFTADGDTAVPGSEVVLFEQTKLSNSAYHDGGALHFGPDDKLYISTGDNGKPGNSKALKNLLGKILRINADGSIPDDNPFFSTAKGVNRAIWALGLRNPFTFTFQPGTGRMFINDVGENTWEEINDGIAGSNYGWPDTEGPTKNPLFRSPLRSYRHRRAAVTGCAVIGGAFYNPVTRQFPPEYLGTYFYADFCSGWIRTFDAEARSDAGFATGISTPVDLLVSDDGGLYYLSRAPGAVHRISFTGAQAASSPAMSSGTGATISSGAPVAGWANRNP
jgi:glucose/arabinose dehydrogenase